ncbi:MAG: hypothetical protein H0W36_09720 [Gemmatimonadetes bacterium]|nr:hypothetical protein [Gemmatimonadota bacterium]
MGPVQAVSKPIDLGSLTEKRGQLLSHGEQARLSELERIIERGLQTFVEVAAALLEIRDARLYRASHATFEAYARERFQLARTTAYGYCDAARVLANVSPERHDLSLSHLRALAPLEAGEQRELAGAISPLTVAEARRVIRAWREQRRHLVAVKDPPPLPAGTFRTLVADPPWRYEHDWGDGLAADQYATMPTEEIAAMPVTDLAAPDSHLYLCTPASKLPEGLSVLAAWGFEFQTVLTWVKPGLGLGTWFRHSTEHVLFGRRGTLRTSPNVRNWFDGPRRRHSAKPEEFYELVEKASPGPYLELFARREREGWTGWGAESPIKRGATGR